MSKKTNTDKTKSVSVKLGRTSPIPKNTKPKEMPKNENNGETK